MKSPAVAQLPLPCSDRGAECRLAEGRFRCMAAAIGRFSDPPLSPDDDRDSVAKVFLRHRGQFFPAIGATIE